MTAPAWTQVLVHVGDVDADLAVDRLWMFGPAAVEVRDAGDGTTLVAGFDDADRAALAVAALTDDGLTVRQRAVDDDGLDGWRRWAQAESAPPFVIVPTWLEPPTVRSGQVLLRVDPGRTFGSGSHPTTRMVLGWLGGELGRAGRDDRTPGAPTVLDVGCGSGIVSVGAALLGAGTVVGIDIDLDAPATTAANVATNGVAGRVDASTTPLATVARDRSFDLVIANLLAPIVVDLADDLVRATGEDGTLVVSGLLADRWEATTDRLAAMVVADVITDDGWAAVTLRHRRA